ncbi:MAG: ribosome-associated translation inhibitor RaiA [Patescibacteria group bacterium]|nr:ribosome-associated translation inhibitor RaiA [Patescibacteria group bacterium]
MNIDIKAINIELTPAIKEYIEKKMSGLSKFVEKWEKTGAVEARFELAKISNHHNKGNIYHAEANITLDGELIRAEASGEDANTVVDIVKDVIKAEVIKLKDRKEEKR